MSLIILSAILGLLLGTGTFAFAQAPSPTATHDPLVAPPLPSNPTHFELGRSLYWNWCMTCHGDRGQGLTDEWRSVWEEDHQNCWSRGCHAGRGHDEAFVIPTIVPLIIGESHLAQFSTLQKLSSYLEMTHPPQHPGILSEEEYLAIAVYVFSQNGRSLATATSEPTLTITIATTATFTPAPTFTFTPPALLTTLTPTVTESTPILAQENWVTITISLISLVIFISLLCWFNGKRPPG